MDLSAVEQSAGDVSLETVDDLFREWRRCEADAERVTRVLRCLRAALALDARGQVRALEDHDPFSKFQDQLGDLDQVIRSL